VCWLKLLEPRVVLEAPARLLVVASSRESHKPSRRPSDRRYYRTLSSHMEFGLENSPVQEIANDLNVRGGALRDPQSPMAPVVMDGPGPSL